MPNYAKFFKDILSKKRNFAEKGVVNLTATCNAVIQRSLQEKCRILATSPFLAPLGILNSRKRCVTQELTST